MGEKNKRTPEGCSYVGMGALINAPTASDSEGSDWIYVGDELPKLPEGATRVPVIMSMFDQSYEALRPGQGSITTPGLYNGKLFKQLAVGREIMKYVPVFLPVTHWQYQPEPVQKKL